MKLSRLYANVAKAFLPIQFRPGLNVVLAEIRDPANLDRDTHNVGKTTLAAMIDFCLLRQKRQNFFLFKHIEQFRTFIFFLEIELHDGRHVTIRRSVEEPTKISFAYSTTSRADWSDAPESSWAHWGVAFERAKQILDGLLEFKAAAPWDFRKPLGYALRLQDDYQDVFQLDRFRGPHAEWKPFLAQLIGLDGQLVQKSYELAAEVLAVESEIQQLTARLAGISDSPDLLEGIILLRRKDAAQLDEQLRKFDFAIPEGKIDEKLVEEIERTIAALNDRRYHLRMAEQRIRDSLGETIKFDLKAIERVFGESQVYFGEQLKRDYDALMRFLAAISAERAELLTAELRDVTNELAATENQLRDQNNARVSALAAIREEETFEKYRKLSAHLIELQTTIAVLERQRVQMESLMELRKRLTQLERTREEVIEGVEANIVRATQDGIYRRIRLDFGDFVSAVLDRSAVLSTKVNDEGNIEFSAEVLNDAGTATSADMGHTFKKLLCVAFDVAAFSAYLSQSFVHFVFHDGIFESLDDRKKLRVLEEIRRKCDDGLQQIITVIDSDMPLAADGQRLRFEREEVICLLHDQGPEGRLFKMDAW